MAKKRSKRKVKTKLPKKSLTSSNIDKLYFGKAGHLFVMSELLLQKWNVAMPEVDIGDDIFVVRDKDSSFIKVQVKSANAMLKSSITTASFTTSLQQLRSSADGKLIYFFLVRKDKEWDKIIIIERTELWALYQKITKSIKIKSGRTPKTITIKLTYNGQKIKWKDENIESYHNKWIYFDHSAPKSI